MKNSTTVLKNSIHLPQGYSLPDYDKTSTFTENRASTLDIITNDTG